MSALIFVATELSPFSAGGIGRVLHNMLRCMSQDDRDRCIVLALDLKISAAAFSVLFPGVRLVLIDSSDDSARFDGAGHQPPRRAYSGTVQQWLSAQVLRALRKLSREVDVAYIEFPDWGALAFATLQEKRISGLFRDATIAVRLHSAHAMLLHHEARAIDASDLILVDMERKCLRDCDLVIAQLAAIGERNREIFGFSRAEWDDRLIVHAPPVLLDHATPVSSATPATPDMPLIFGSKIQRIKRPDLFVRGAAGFMAGNSEYIGKALIAAHFTDDAYGSRVTGLIPPDLRDRFDFDPVRGGEAREKLIAQSTFVAPSDFESFCLALYEASLLGARCIVNGTNPAFADGTPWKDGVNCYKFDGTTAGLVAALGRNFDNEPLVPVVVPDSPWPWERWSRPLPDRTPALPLSSPLVSVIVPHYNLGDYVLATISSILQQTYDNIEIIVIDDGSHEASSRSVIEDLTQRSGAQLKVIRAPGNVGLSGVRNIGLKAAAGDYVLPLDADDLIHPRFVEVAVGALEANPAFSVFVTPAAYFKDGDTPGQDEDAADFPDYAMFVGEALVSGVRCNAFSTATAMFRSSAIRQFGYEESLFSYEDWNLYLKLAHGGHRFLVSNAVYFYYRNRAGSMIKEATDPKRHAIFMHDHLRTGVRMGSAVPLSYLAYLEGMSQGSAPVPREAGVLDEGLELLVASAVKNAAARAQPGKVDRVLSAVDRLRGRNGVSSAVRLVSRSDFFDPAWYLSAYPDVAAAKMNPALHYVLNGASEGRDPGPYFSTSGYLAANPDVKAAGANPLVHYMTHGLTERRRKHLGRS